MSWHPNYGETKEAMVCGRCGSVRFGKTDTPCAFCGSTAWKEARADEDDERDQLVPGDRS